MFELRTCVGLNAPLCGVVPDKLLTFALAQLSMDFHVACASGVGVEPSGAGCGVDHIRTLSFQAPFWGLLPVRLLLLSAHDAGQLLFI